MNKGKIDLRITRSLTKKIRVLPGAVVLSVLSVLSGGFLLGQGVSAEELRLPGIDEIERGADAELRLPGVDEIEREADEGLDLPSVCEIMGTCGSSGSYSSGGY